MTDAPLITHSLAEAYLYFQATPCPTCGKGPLQGSDPQSLRTRGEDVLVTIDATCRSCRGTAKTTFQVPETRMSDEEEADVINNTEEASRILDVAQWITLSFVINESAARETDRVRARQLGLGASQCLEEALKFYDDADNDLPPPEALFHDSSRRRLRDHPEEFSKRRLINRRAKLPRMSAVRPHPSPVKSRPELRWWRSQP